MQPPLSPAKILAWAEQDGVDLSMLRERLEWTPTEHLQRHQATLALVEALCATPREEKVRRTPGRDAADSPMQAGRLSPSGSGSHWRSNDNRTGLLMRLAVTLLIPRPVTFVLRGTTGVAQLRYPSFDPLGIV